MTTVPSEDWAVLLARATLGASTRPVELTVRQLLRAYGAKRRGNQIVRAIDHSLGQVNLVAEPPISSTWIDGEIRLMQASLRSDLDRGPELATVPDEFDIRFTVGSLRCATSGIISVAPGHTLRHALSIMMRFDYSQLAVMEGARSVKGVISWESIGKANLFSPVGLVSDAMVSSPLEVELEDDLIPLIPRVIEGGFALVRAKDEAVSGIVTPADLSNRFVELAQPFILLEEIERRLRLKLDRCFSPSALRAALGERDGHVIEGVDDLTIGDVLHLISRQDNFELLEWPIERSEFVKALEEVRLIRNDVMHFSPDPIDEGELLALNRFIGWLRDLEAPISANRCQP